MVESLAVVVAFVFGTPAKPLPQAPVAPFSITVESHPTGWSARCDSGCAWRAAAFECPTACGAFMDSNGIFTAATIPPRPNTFMFYLTRTARGVEAHARSGTAWSKLVWACDTSDCRVAIDGFWRTRRQVRVLSGPPRLNAIH
jgi:hypothetical protein